MKTETTTRSEFLKGGKAIVEQILVSEERNPKEQDYENQSAIQVGKLTNCVRSFEIIKIITEFSRSISSNKIGQSVLIMDVKVSKNKHIRRLLIERTSSMLDEIEPKIVHKVKEGD